jgi:hypothetical protein
MPVPPFASPLFLETFGVWFWIFSLRGGVAASLHDATGDDAVGEHVVFVRPPTSPAAFLASAATQPAGGFREVLPTAIVYTGDSSEARRLSKRACFSHRAP